MIPIFVPRSKLQNYLNFFLSEPKYLESDPPFSSVRSKIFRFLLEIISVLF